MDFFVGTVSTPPHIYTLRFTAPAAHSSASLDVANASPAIGPTSWLALSLDKKFLYTTAWTTPPSIAAYRITPSHVVEFINTKPVRATSGYVACSRTHLYSVGGPTGEVFTISPDGGIGELVQELEFVDSTSTSGGAQSKDVHGDFGGLRHGAHSVDLSPDGQSLYVADIGRNCIWSFSIAASAAGGGKDGSPHLELGSKHISPRATDGPRHTTPHPAGKMLYSLQEHSSMVDAFSVAEDGFTLKHVAGVKIIPAAENPKDYWADEVRLSKPAAEGEMPRYLYASTRGLQPRTKGYVAVFRLGMDGRIEEPHISMLQTPTSGGIANAVEPAPRNGRGLDDVEYLALTDTEDGLVVVLEFDGKDLKEIARLKLEEEGVEVVKPATAVWT